MSTAWAAASASLRNCERTQRDIIVATKAGRRLSPHTADGYNEKNLTAFIEDSLRNLATDCLDLVQLHCPPTDVYYRPEVFGALDRLMEAGKIRYYGVSVERVEEALKAIEYPNVQTVQIIFNCFRQRPARAVFRRGQARRGRHSGARSAGERDAHGQADARIAIRRRRPPELQPPRREASTWARPSPAWITMSALEAVEEIRRAAAARHDACRSSRCAGS